LFTTPGWGTHISGVILYKETLTQATDDGVPFVKLMADADVLPGIKTDMGLGTLPTGENFTKGLDTLAERAAEFYSQGARFSKWRNVYHIDVAKGFPSALSIQENAWTLARQASISQANGLVPIVEPEILADGDHSIEVSAAITERVQAAVAKALQDNMILWEGCLLKPNMVTPGFGAPRAAP
jgi:fructose-bisphosphate aldolase class I